MDKEAVYKIIDLEKKLTACENVCKHKTREIEELQAIITKNNNFEADHEALKSRSHHLEQQLLEKIVELNTLKAKHSDLEELCAKDKEVVSCKDTEICELKKKIKELEKLPAQLTEAERKYELLSDEINELQDLTKKKDQTIEILDKEISSVEKELDKNVKESKKLLKKELNYEGKLEKEVESLVKKLAEAHAEVDELKKKCSAVHNLEKRHQHREAETTKIQEKYRKLEEKNEHLETKVHDLNTEVHTLKENLKRKSTSLTQLEKEDKILVAEFEESQKESTAKLEKITSSKKTEIEKLNKTYETEISKLQANITALKTEIDHLTSEKNRISEVLEFHVARERELFGRVEDLKKEREFLTIEIFELISEKDRLKGAAATIDKEAFKLDRDVHRLSDEKKHFTARIDELEKNLEHKRSVITERDAEIAHLKENLAKAQHAHSEIVHERNNLRLENSSIANKLAELENSYSTIMTKYNNLEKLHGQCKGETAIFEDTAIETEKISHMKEADVVQKKSHSKGEVHDKKY